LVKSAASLKVQALSGFLSIVSHYRELPISSVSTASNKIEEEKNTRRFIT